MIIGIGSDHAGYKLKALVLDYLSKEKIDFIDFGTDTEAVSVDYPDFISKVGYAVSKGEIDRGIVICGSGIGASIVANKIQGVRAALCTNEYLARLSRLHNNANVLALGQRVTAANFALSIVNVWLNTDFEGERHQHRLDKITKIENNQIENNA